MALSSINDDGCLSLRMAIKDLLAKINIRSWLKPQFKVILLLPFVLAKREKTLFGRSLLFNFNVCCCSQLDVPSLVLRDGKVTFKK